MRCPFSLARMIKVTEDGTVIYRTGKSTCLRFPEHGDDQLKAGTLRNFQVFDPLEFLAEVTQHIPEKGQHQILYFGFYSNKQRGMRNKKKDVDEDKPICSECEVDETSEYAKKRRMSWAALIKSVYEVDPLECPNCGARMKIISFIEKCQPVVIEKILRHCGMWKETVQRVHQESDYFGCSGVSNVFYSSGTVINAGAAFFSQSGTHLHRVCIDKLPN